MERVEHKRRQVKDGHKNESLWQQLVPASDEHHAGAGPAAFTFSFA